MLSVHLNGPEAGVYIYTPGLVHFNESLTLKWA